MRTIKIAFVTVMLAFLLMPSLSEARRASLTVHKPPSVTTSTHRSKVVRGDMTRINIAVSAKGASAEAARKRVGSAAWQTERAVQKLIPSAKVVKGPLSVGGRYVRGKNDRYYWRNEQGRSSQNIVIEFKGTSSVKAAKVIDFAAKAAQKASGKTERTNVSLDISEAEHFLSQNKMNRTMNQMGRSLRHQATQKARGMLHKGERLSRDAQYKLSTGGYSPWRGGGWRVYGDVSATIPIERK
jgi:hypothetical protein